MSQKKENSKVQGIDSNTDIDSLQKQLFSSLASVFDPTAKNKSDEDFLSKDFDLKVGLEDENDENQQQNPYYNLTKKAKLYTDKLESIISDPDYKKKTVKSKKDSETFQLTNVGIEGSLRERPLPKPTSEEKDEEIDVDMNDVLGSMNNLMGELDDLEELRRMIRETKKEMKEYGKDLLVLKNNVTEMNDYADKELGYSASGQLISSMEHTLNELKDKKGFKYIKKNNVTPASLKSLPPPITTKAKMGNSATTTNPSLIAKPASFLKHPGLTRGLTK